MIKNVIRSPCGARFTSVLEKGPPRGPFSISHSRTWELQCRGLAGEGRRRRGRWGAQGRPQGAHNPPRECGHPQRLSQGSPSWQTGARPQFCPHGLCGLRKVTCLWASVSSSVRGSYNRADPAGWLRARPASGEDDFPVPPGDAPHPPPSPLHPHTLPLTLPLASRHWPGPAAAGWMSRE